MCWFSAFSFLSLFFLFGVEILDLVLFQKPMSLEFRLDGSVVLERVGRQKPKSRTLTPGTLSHRRSEFKSQSAVVCSITDSALLIFVGVTVRGRQSTAIERESPEI